MTATVCMTVDVEDFYEGMEVLGHRLERPADVQGALSSLLSRLEAHQSRPRVTLFVVAGHATSVGTSLAEFAAAGHEIACHGPDHGRFPDAGVVAWLRAGKERLEDMLGVPIRGFRSPRFDLPGDATLSRYREQLAEAGYAYVSDTYRLGASSPVAEYPVLACRGLPVGGGSYQRLLPLRAVARAVKAYPGRAVLYYHSYDFDGSLPALSKIRSIEVAKQLLGRKRIANAFFELLGRFGSETCWYAGR